MRDEYDDLDAETRRAVDKAIAEAKRTHGHYSVRHADGDVYAYPHPSGRGTSWGVNGGSNGFNVARGIR